MPGDRSLRLLCALLVWPGTAQVRTSREILSLAPPAYDERIRYGADASQFADLRRPDTRGRAPVVVVIHGGFWRARYDLGYAGHMSAAITRLGFATWNIEYRRIGQAGGGFPGTLEDVAAAVDHLAGLGGVLDLNRVYAIGHSAGGHLALWLAARNNPKVRIAGVVSLAGVADLRSAWEHRLGDGVVDQLMGCSPGDCPEKYQAASPAERLPFRVPVALVHGDRDDIVPFAMAERFLEAAKRAGGRTHLVRLAGAGHFEMVDPRSAEWKQVEVTLLSVTRR